MRGARPFDLPIGVSIYPTRNTPRLLWEAGVAEVKFNIEAATPGIFAEMCPGQDWNLLWEVLAASVRLFGKNHVQSNIIVGLGESDDEMEEAIRQLCRLGVIPILRPLTPAQGSRTIAALTPPGCSDCTPSPHGRWRRPGSMLCRPGRCAPPARAAT